MERKNKILVIEPFYGGSHKVSSKQAFFRRIPATDIFVGIILVEPK